MAKAYSQDLRERVIHHYLRGFSKIAIVTVFEIGMDTLNRWIRHYQATGHLQPKLRTRYRARKFSDSDLLNYIQQHPSATLVEMAHYFSVKHSSVRARLIKLGITYKKKYFFTKKEMKLNNHQLKLVG